MDEIVRVELQGDMPIQILHVPSLPHIEAKTWDDFTEFLPLEITDYVRHYEELGLCGLKYVHFKRRLFTN